MSIVNARAVARERGIDIIETRSSRARHFTSLVSIKLHTDSGERWVEGTVFEPNNLRLVSVDGVNVEAPLGGTMLIVANDDQPGVIGEVGTILGRHGVNIANFALGRGEDGAIGVVNVDEEPGSLVSSTTPSRKSGGCRRFARPGSPASPDGDEQRAGMDSGTQGRPALHRLAVHVKHHRPIAFDRRSFDAADRTARHAIDRSVEEPRHVPNRPPA